MKSQPARSVDYRPESYHFAASGLAGLATSLKARFSALCLPVGLTAGLFLASAVPATAETLYQWQESDGSLTFSPTPPPEGSNIDFKVVESDQGVNPVEALDDSVDASSLAQISSAQSAASKKAAEPINRLAYANDNSTRSNAGDLPAGISAGTQQQETTTAVDSNLQSGQISPERQAKMARLRDCENLNKRVVALENHMKHSTTAEEMDRAVLQISRYQTSIDGYCHN